MAIWNNSEIEALKKERDLYSTQASTLLRENIQLKDQLKKLNMQIAMPKIHNERGAGRRSRIENSHITFVSKYIADGKGVSEIARLLSDNTGTHWSKSTVQYLVKQHLGPRF